MTWRCTKCENTDIFDVDAMIACQVDGDGKILYFDSSCMELDEKTAKCAECDADAKREK